MDMQELMRVQTLLVETTARQEELLARTAQVIDRQQQDIGRLQQQSARMAEAVQEAGQRLEGGGQRFGQDAIRIITEKAGEAVAGGVGKAVQQVKLQLEEATHSAQWTANQVKEAALELRKQRSLWLWAAPMALIVGALLAAGGSGYLVWKNMQELKRAEFAQDILNATQTGTLTRCGEVLCAKVGRQPKRHGKDGEYALLQD